MPRSRFGTILLFVLALLLVGAPRAARAAAPLDPKAVPEPLKPWTAWALDGKDDALCPLFFGHADVSRCAWPARLSLTLDDHGGRLSQSWHVEGLVKRWVQLPGDEKRWPQDVKVDGARAIVLSQAGGPSVQVGPGDHVITGSFVWDAMPESLHVPPETGLLELGLRGAAVVFPNRDTQGTVWLQKASTNEEGDALSFVVHRKVIDDIPLSLLTRIEVRVAGKSREELLGKTLPAGFVPLSLESPLPARLEPDGRLRVQVRPGVYAIELTARSPGPVRSITRPAPEGPWREGDEIWVFEAKNDYRVVSVEGISSIDPQQTTLPDGWKQLPAYPMKVGATLELVEKRRGDADPPPNQLALERTLWLDFDGSGYSVRDHLTGSLNRDSRLSMTPPTILGRVSVGGRDQFITHLAADPSRTGVEVRQGDIRVDADSRIAGNPSDIPAVSWAHDFHQVQGTLHLPPGWRLLHAAGVDDVPDTWLRRWSLLQLFLGLIVAIGIGRLYGVRWGAVAAAMLLLTLPEADAPRWSWLAVLVLEALTRVVPRGRVRQLLGGARVAAVLLVTLFALPFLVQNIREGMYPALVSPEARVGANDTGLYATLDEERNGDQKEGGTGTRARGETVAPASPPPPPAVDAPAPLAQAPAAADRDSRAGGKLKDTIDGKVAPAGSSVGWGGSGGYYRTENAETYDPSAVVQTGPGLPHWTWSTIPLRWSGPVASAQRLHLYLAPPIANLLFAFLRALLLGVVLLRLFPPTQAMFPPGWGPPFVAAALGVAIVLGPCFGRVALADVPDKATLDELSSRLLRQPDCTPACASSGRMAIEVRAGSLRVRVEVDASAATAVPLPGGSAQWTPTQVLLDGQPAKGLLHQSDGVLWIELLPGTHQIVLEGPMPDRDSIQLTLHMKPHRVEASSVGYVVAGVHEDGLADDDLQLTRVRSEDGGTGASLQPGELPPFARVERTLQVGLNWQVDTRIVRLSPLGTAVVLEVPLLAGESVTTADMHVVAGKVLVNMGPQAREAGWHSVLEQRSPVKLRASTSLSWVELWRVDVGPIWHATFAGIPFVHIQPNGGTRVPEWRPWPGEEATVEIVRPDGVPGQTLTIDESTTTVSPGLRATDVTLAMSLRSSRGAEHVIVLPPDAQLESVEIDGKKPPVRQDGRKVTLPIVPGAQSVTLVWRQTPGIGLMFSSPPIDLGAPSVNANTTIQLSDSRWLLLAGGPRVGPAVLFWSLLVVLVGVSIALGMNHWTPLKTWHWALLSIGLSQVSVIAGAVFVGWLLALGFRGRAERSGLGRGAFNLRQAGLVAWTAVALGILAVSLYQGLLGAPEMQVMGNGSGPWTLHWFTDRTSAALPKAWVVSVPVLVYRGAMLAWALWSALALLGWLRWGWGAFSQGGVWKKKPPRVIIAMPPPPPPAPPVPPPPPAPPGT